MRITDRMTQRGLVDDIHRQQETMLRLQAQIASGKLVQNLSDDPARAARSLALNAAQAALTQHQKNAQEGITWMNTTLASLSNARETIQTARTTAVQGATDSMTADSRQTLATSVDQMITQLREVANAKWNGLSLFAGNKTTTAAFSDTGAYQGDAGTMTRDIAPGETAVINVTGQQAFLTGDNAFQVLADLKTALNNNDGSAVNALLPRLDTVMNNMLKLEAELGSQVKRVENTNSRLDELGVTLTKQISENDDTDMPRAIVDLQNADTLYQASLKASSTLFNTSLLDYLR